MEGTAQSEACPDCHALTDDLDAHRRWHSRLVHDLAVAVTQDRERRASSTS